VYVQAAEASPSNRIIIEKDLWNLENGRAGITKVRDGIEKNVEKGFDGER